MAKLEIKLVKSAIGAKPKQRQTLEALGLTKINKTVVKADNEAMRGMIKIVAHLVEVIEN